MSWLTDIAGRAERLLNDVDAAAASKLAESGLATPARRTPPSASGTAAANPAATPLNDSIAPAVSQTAPPGNSASRTALSKERRDKAAAVTRRSTLESRLDAAAAAADKEDDLMAFLNEPDKASGEASAVTSAADTASSTNGHASTNGTSSRSEPPSTSSAAAAAAPAPASSAASSHSNGGVAHAPELDGTQANAKLAKVTEENKLLRNEIAALEDEVRSFASRTRSMQDTLADTRKALASCEKQLATAHAARQDALTRERELMDTNEAREKQVASLQQQVKLLQKEKDMTLGDHKAASEAQSQAFDSLRRELDELKREKQNRQLEEQRSQTSAEKEVQTLRDQLLDAQTSLQTLEQTAEESKAALADQVSQLRASQSELATLQREYTEYKTRASRVLQTKEKLISDLRANGTGGDEQDGESGGASFDVLQLRSERDALDQELNETRAQLSELRLHVQQLEQQQQADADWADEQFKDLEQALKEETKKRQDLERERELELKDREIEREDWTRDKLELQKQLADRDAQLDETKAKLSRKANASTGTLELENRLHMLTESLIHKQSQIEALNAEKMSLALQLEGERKRRDEVKIDIPPAHTPHHRHGDDGQMQPIASIPSMPRRLRDAANVLDAFSVRLGVFLRRYPIARIFVILYMLLLHVWVMIVLLTYTPEMHGHGQDFHPLAVGAPGAAQHLDAGRPQ